ncbi:MAG: DNA gyrase subunit A [Nitrospirae bacterium]|nr:DNA gyrase subunit A [Nitrospirota bacterium]
MSPNEEKLSTSFINIEEEMKTSYLDYAMSVIVGRALPDVRDGLKPVHRRVLYTMSELSLTYNKPYKKSARVVGDVMGKFHPHGDSAIYDTLVRMAQDFSLRYMLVDGQGNFGSIDGDPPAAMRYTESRMAKITNEMLADIDKDTVNFVPNYNEELLEPTVLPARIPNLLINGSTGIAVGMATNIPPHNLREVIDGLTMLIDNPEATVFDLMKAIKGPDFPTGGIIQGRRGIEEAYLRGRGMVRVRARAEVEPMEKKGDREAIIISELPYTVNKARLVEKIAELVREKKITGISDIRDESDRQGMRVVLELKRGEIGSVILNQLYKHTAMQTTFGVIMLALVNNQPRVLNLKNVLTLFIAHRKDVVIRRTRYELKKAEERAHILEGLKIALDNLDAVIKLIRAAAGPEDAKTGLKINFGLSDLQAQAILDMRLQRLTGLERDKIIAEYKEILLTIENLKAILASDRRILEIIREEFVVIKESYGDNRRTEIADETDDLTIEDLIAEEEMVITISHTGYIKRNPLTLYRSQRRGGKGKIGMETKEEDFVARLFTASTHDYLLFFTDKGRVYWLKVYQVPEAGRTARGKAIVNLISKAPDENVTAVIPVREFSEDAYLMMATRMGMVKKTSLSAYGNPRATGIIGIKLKEGDSLIRVQQTTGDSEVLLATRQGMAIRFKETDVRDMGRDTTGVYGIKLRADDDVVGMELVTADTTILSATENGYGKRTKADEYRIQTRGGSGLINIKTTKRNGFVVGIAGVDDTDEVMLITTTGKVIRLEVKGVSTIGRNTQGVKLLDVGEGDKVVSIAKLAEKEGEAGDPAGGPDEGGAEEVTE